MRKQHLVCAAESLVYELRADRNMEFAAPARDDLAIEPLHGFANKKDGRIVIGRKIMEKRDTKLGPDVIDAKRLKQTVSQVVD